MKDGTARLMAAGSAALSVLAVVFSGWQAVIAQRGFDRASGLSSARATIVGTHQDLPFPARPTLAGNPMPGWAQADKLDTLIAANPSVVVENTGDEPIEAIRLETRMEAGFIDRIGQPEAATEEDPAPWAFRQADGEDIPLPHKLAPGQAMRIPILRGVVGQLAQNQAAKLADRRHFGIFVVRCSARLVGASHFDPVTSVGPVGLKVSWIPSGYPNQRCEQFVRDFRPAIEDVKPGDRILPPIDRR